MAVNKKELSAGDLFSQLGMLIIQGRKWDNFRKCRVRGIHCPSLKNLPLSHQCSQSNTECQSILSLQKKIYSIGQGSTKMTIDVILYPACGHQSSMLLLERWSLKFENGCRKSSMPLLSLMQAIDSTIHFSQLSSWWASSNGSQPENIQYRVYHEDSISLGFIEKPVCHQFPPSHNVKVQVQYLPRQQRIPDLHCRQCSMNAPDPQPVIDCPSRGRSFVSAGRRRGSRHSSASSDSLSPSITRLDLSPCNSPLSTSCLYKGFSSSSSRGSSCTGSPCFSRSSSERNMVLNFEASLHMNEEMEDAQTEDIKVNSRTGNDSGFVDQTIVGNTTIDQDEELANQLDSLSDSDLSDDYVIDGPIGSPGLVGSSVASPDDARVQMLQSAYAGWHCRRPTFDRLMSESGPNRTRHSSLDSAVSNMERLELKARQRLSRTSSDGQDFADILNKGNKEFVKGSVIKDRKKRQKMYNLDLSNCSHAVNANNAVHTSFCTSGTVKADPSFDSAPVFGSLLNTMHTSSKYLSHDVSAGFPSFSASPSSALPPSAPPNPFGEIFHCDVKDNCHENGVANLKICQVNSASQRNKDNPHSAKGVWDIPYPAPSLTLPHCNGVVSNIDRPQYNGMQKTSNGHALSHNTLSCHSFLDDNSRAAAVIPDQNGDLDKCKQTDKQDDLKFSSLLLRSPPSKLRILPSKTSEKNYLHNPPRDVIHKVVRNDPRQLRFHQTSEKPTCSSPAPIRRNNSIRFEFDEDMPKLNQRTSRSVCRGKCMKKNGVVHTHSRGVPARRLLGSFEESIFHECLEVLGTVEGFTAQLGASGSFCPSKVWMPVSVRFFHISDDNAPSPYLGTMSLKRRECGKRGYHIPRKGTIQLTLFNPNKSVVKVFVILYDVSDMPPGHRTFLRHRIYSKATPQSSGQDCNSNHLSVSTEGTLQQGVPNLENPCLKYCVNLWLESSKTNKVYIHGEVKILFSLASNEWDSGNTYELKAETQFPEDPRYSSKR